MHENARPYSSPNERTTSRVRSGTASFRAQARLRFALRAKRFTEHANPVDLRSEGDGQVAAMTLEPTST